LITVSVVGQTPIDVAENTLKIGALGEEEFYYGFAEGDQIIFNFEELKGKELKEIEIIELPNSSKFMDYKSNKIENKTITISTTGIYKFRFSNSAMSGRICKVKIQRIPANESTKNFNTSVYWKTVNDTTFTTVEERYLISRDTVVHNITDQLAKVHSTTNANGNKTTFNFTLPPNTVSWSYYVGVDQAGQEAFDQAVKEITSKAAPVVSKFPGYGPLAALALGSASYISQIQQGEDIDYYICDRNNVNLFLSGQAFYYVKKGKVINDFSRMTTNLKGSYHFCLSNDNAITGVTVTVKVTAIAVTENFGTRPIEKMNVTSRQEAYLKN
jgi:hypothetical protein